MPIPAYDDVRPSVEDVAALEQTRTTGGNSLGGDEGDGTFTETTVPSASQVEAVIDTALDLIVPQLGTLLTGDAQLGMVKRAVALQAAIIIEGSYFREQIDQGSVSLWSALLARLMTGLGTLSGSDVITTPGSTPAKVYRIWSVVNGTAVSSSPEAAAVQAIREAWLANTGFDPLCWALP